MSSSRGRLQLLLGWALVLGQLLGGSEEVSPPAFSSGEQLNPPDESCCQRLNPEMRYKENVARFLKRMERQAATEPDPVDFEWKRQAVEALNNERYHSPEHMVRVEETFIKVEKPYGVHVTIPLTLKKTTCTREEMDHHQGPLTNSFLDHNNCTVVNGEEAEVKDCIFQIAFSIEPGNHKVIDHRCNYF